MFCSHGTSDWALSSQQRSSGSGNVSAYSPQMLPLSWHWGHGKEISLCVFTLQEQESITEVQPSFLVKVSFTTDGEESIFPFVVQASTAGLAKKHQWSVSANRAGKCCNKCSAGCFLWAVLKHPRIGSVWRCKSWQKRLIHLFLITPISVCPGWFSAFSSPASRLLLLCLDQFFSLLIPSCPQLEGFVLLLVVHRAVACFLLGTLPCSCFPNPEHTCIYFLKHPGTEGGSLLRLDVFWVDEDEDWMEKKKKYIYICKYVFCFIK